MDWVGERLRQENSLSFTTKLLWLLQRFCQTWIFTRVIHSEGNFKLCKLHRIYYYDPKDRNFIRFSILMAIMTLEI